MKRIIIGSLVSLAVLTIVASAKAGTFAVINMKKVFTTCRASKEAQSELNKIIKVKKAIINKKRAELNALFREINSKKLSKKEKEAKERIYQEKLKELRDYASKAQQEIMLEERKMSSKILQGIVNTVKAYAKRHHLDAVFNTSQGGIIYWNNSLDITNKIIKIYDEEYGKKK